MIFKIPSYKFLSCTCVCIGFLALSCGPKKQEGFGLGISTDPKQITEGQKTFELLCSACHNFEQDAIGPNLSGLTRTVETDWIREFVKGPKKMIDSKDERAVALKEKYSAFMPDFGHLSSDELDAVLAYMHSYGTVPLTKKTDTLQPVRNPIMDTVPFSDQTAHLEFFAQIPASQETPPMARINKLDCEKGSGRLFINDLRGYLYELKGGKPQLFLDLKECRPNFIDHTGLGTGFGSFAFHPEFSLNGLFYTTHTETTGSGQADFTLPNSIPVKFQWVVTEWKTGRPDSRTFAGTSRELIRFDLVWDVHGVQEIIFNPHSQKGDADYGMLYIGIGDGGAVQTGNPKLAHHQGSDIWASILRIDPLGNNSTNANYGIPKDNPFASSPALKREIWAYGFRNPNRITWDKAGKMLASDIGETNIEEVNWVEPGKFYGWPIREGTFMFHPEGDRRSVYPLPKNDSVFSVTYPLMQYDHDESPAISGGFVSQGTRFKDSYVFGDIPTGKLFVSDLNTAKSPRIEELKIIFENQETTLAKMAGNNRVDLRLGIDCMDNIYIFTKADGRIYTLREF